MNVSSFSRYALSVCGAAAMLIGCGGSAAPSVQAATDLHQTSCPPCLYVANYGADGGNSITVYPVRTTGNVTPIQYLNGSHTQLCNPDDVAVDSSNNMYVANICARTGHYSITVYAAGATGNTAPTAVISGSNTGLNEPEGIALDPVNGDIYVANSNGGPSDRGTVTIYAPGSNGNVAPIGTIAGAATGLDGPGGLTLDQNGNIYVPNVAGGGSPNNSVTIYAAATVGNVAPTRTIRGSDTKLYAPKQVALDSSSNIYVANDHLAKSTITVYAAGANGNVAPIGRISAKKTDQENTDGVALDASGIVYAASFSGNDITMYSVDTETGIAKTLGDMYKEVHMPVGLAIR